MTADRIKILERALVRERAARKEAERILEEKSAELFTLSRKLKQSNEQLKNVLSQRNSELQGVFDNLVDAYVLMNTQGEVLKMNDAAIDLFGYNPAEEIINVANLIYKEDISYAMTSFESLLQNGFFTDYQARVYTKHKEVRTVHINASLIYDNDKKPVAAQGIVRDITDELESKRIFEEQKQQLQTIVENSSLGIVLTYYGTIVQSNKAFQELLGYTAEELLELSVKDVSAKDKVEESIQQMEQLNKGAIDQFTMNKKYIKKDRTHVWARTNVSAVRNVDKSIRFQIALIEDITDELAAEQRQQVLMADLEKSNKDLSDFAHIVSHDLKSPLRSMDALINWLREDYGDSFDEGANETFELLLEKVFKMDHLIEGILQYSSIDKKSVGRQPINTQNIVDDLLRILFIPDHVTIQIVKPLPVILGDHYRLQQLFQNILSNAISAMDKEKGEITIDYEEASEYWTFSIQDNGKGIPEKYRKKVFEMFESIDGDKKSTGIGLSIVKKIIDYYKGTMHLNSEVDVGTTFSFTIPK